MNPGDFLHKGSVITRYHSYLEQFLSVVDHIRHPYSHKNEIEKQVQEMLTSCMIRPSNSFYSSPVILVKKSDGT